MRTGLVTGASSGIGREFARQLAADGHDLVLVARSADRLQTLAATLTREHGIRAEVLAADLTDGTDLARVAARARDVDLVVNSAGVGMRLPFLDSDLASEEAMFDLLCTAVLTVSHAAGVGMRARGAGRIINVSSVAGWLTTGTYSAHKSWVTVFSECLAGELGGSGVSVTALCPGFVRTEFHERAGIATRQIPDRLWSDVEDVVGRALADSAAGRVLSVPGLPNRTVAALAPRLPRALVRRAGLRVARGRTA